MQAVPDSTKGTLSHCTTSPYGSFHIDLQRSVRARISRTVGRPCDRTVLIGSKPQTVDKSLEEESVVRQNHERVEDDSQKPNRGSHSTITAIVNVHRYMRYIWVDSFRVRTCGSKKDEDMK